MNVCVPRTEEARAIPVGGPRHYPVKTCAERGFHVVRFSLTGMKCQHCDAEGDVHWGKRELVKEGDFYLELGSAIEDLARTQIRERRTIFDSPNEGLSQAAKNAGGKAR